MNLTSNFDYCAEMGIEQVKIIFHLAFKEEGRFPHNIPSTYGPPSMPMSIMVNVLDDEDRPADLSFLDEKHIQFSIPFDIIVSIPDAPDPTLSSITLHARVAMPALLDTWAEDGKDVLGPSFAGITEGDVQVLELTGVPTIGVDNFRRAIHHWYTSAAHTYTQGANTLNIYDGNSDPLLTPPNAGTPFDIQADLETHSSTEYLKVVIAINVYVPLDSGAYSSYGRITFWRRVERTDTTITIHMEEEPSTASLKTKVELDTASASTSAEIDQLRIQLHAKYDLLPNHTFTLAGNTLILYDDTRDATLSPPNNAVPADIDGVLEMDSGIEYMKVTLPIYVNVPIAAYTSYGHIVFWRPVSRVSGTVSVDMTATPGDTDSALVTQVNLDNGPSFIRDMVASNLRPLADSSIAGFGTVATASAGSSVADQLLPLAIQAIDNMGPITDPALTDAAARTLLKAKVAEYLATRRYPIYSPDSGDPDRPLSTPVPFLLVSAGVLALLMNRRSGTAADDFAPDNFLAGSPLALAAGRDYVLGVMTDVINTKFPGVNDGGYELHRPQGDATLKTINADLEDSGEHDTSPGHVWISGEAEVHIDCWPDPDVSFEGPIFIDATPEEHPDGTCDLPLQARAGDFDIDESCCDVLLDLLIPVVGIIMLVVIENTINEVGGQIADETAAGTGDQIQAIPPIINGIAKVRACLVGLNIFRQGFVFPGTMEIDRYTTSYEDREGENSLPRPDSP